MSAEPGADALGLRAFAKFVGEPFLGPDLGYNLRELRVVAVDSALSDGADDLESRDAIRVLTLRLLFIKPEIERIDVDLADLDEPTFTEFAFYPARIGHPLHTRMSWIDDAERTTVVELLHLELAVAERLLDVDFDADLDMLVFPSDQPVERAAIGDRVGGGISIVRVFSHVICLLRAC